jgi:hypothetical protein
MALEDLLVGYFTHLSGSFMQLEEGFLFCVDPVHKAD